jgi:hypothetical protein
LAPAISHLEEVADARLLGAWPEAPARPAHLDGGNHGGSWSSPSVASLTIAISRMSSGGLGLATPLDFKIGPSSHETCMGLFLSSGCFWVLLPVLCSERERPFFIPSPAIRFPERAEGVKGPKR